MTFFKLMTTTTIVGLISTAAFADSINFSQGTGNIKEVSFTQTNTGGAANTISRQTDASTSKSSVIGNLETLSITQDGIGNSSTFNITTATDVDANNVEMFTDGDNNSSDLTVTQQSGDTLEFIVAINGSGNDVDAVVTNTSSKVNLLSDGDNANYDIDQVGTPDNAGTINTIVANVVKSGLGTATIELSQTGDGNNINLGDLGGDDFGSFGSNYGFNDGSGGLTLQGSATVSIIQTADGASYTASNTVRNGGSLTILQN